MSHANSQKESESKRTDLRNIFDNMAYDNNGTASMNCIKKWLVESQKSMLTSYVNATPFGDDSDVTTFTMEGLSKILGISISARLLSKDAAVVEAYKRIYKQAEITILNNDEREDRKSKFKDLVKNKVQELLKLEAYAGGVPTWVVQKNDEPKWFQSLNASISIEIRKQIEAGNPQILLHLSADTYSLASVISVLSAALQVDCPILFFISPKEISSIRQLLPALYLIDSINSSRIRNAPIDVLLLAPEILKPGLMNKLAALDGSLKRSFGVIEIGDTVSNDPITFNVKTAVLNLLTSKGRSVHYVVDSSADISSAISSITRNTWSSGIQMNHRCRLLAFIHQPVYAQVVKELGSYLENMKINRWDSSDLTNCDFLSKQIDVSKTFLTCVDELGAKILPRRSDYSAPTVVYDIGTSSDLVAIKQPGLGHILCLIPYRSPNELFSLGNNFGVPDQVFVYSNCITTSMNMIRKLNASEILVNSASPSASSVLELSWKVVSKSELSGRATKEQRGNASTLNVKPDASKWLELSSSSKTKKLNQLVKVTSADAAILPVLLSSYLDLTHGHSLCTPRTANSVSSAVILADADGISTSNFITALIACVLREKPVVVVSIGSEISTNITKSVKDILPPGLISFVKVDTSDDIALLASRCELIWVMQGTDITVDLSFLSSISENQTLLVNNSDDNDLEISATVAITSAFKYCYI